MVPEVVPVPMVPVIENVPQVVPVAMVPVPMFPVLMILVTQDSS